MKCIKCSRKVFLTEELCREHYCEMYAQPVLFRKIKENSIRDVIKYEMKYRWGIDVVTNKKLPGTRLLPDLHFILFGVLCLIEIDEYQHQKGDYDLKENDRLNQITTVYDQCIMIRINPDKYKTYPDIWTKKLKIVKPGQIEEVVSENKDEWQRRRSTIVTVLNNVIVSIIEKRAQLANYNLVSKFFTHLTGITGELQLMYLFFDTV